MKFGRRYLYSTPIPPNILSPGLIALIQHHSLPRNQVPEWASAYINYKGLKKLIKAEAETAKAGKDVDIAGVIPP